MLTLKSIQRSPSMCVSATLRFAFVSTEASETDAPVKKANLPKVFLRPKHFENVWRPQVEFYDEIYKHHTFIMSREGDWPDIWPAPAPFNPYLVPLPVRMGMTRKYCVKPDKFSTLELMKLQNFLHLTPPAIKRHCRALKELCTEFPEELKSDEACEKEFPVEVHYRDIITAENSPRNAKARVVTKRIRLCHLALDKHARTKMKYLLQNKRFRATTDEAIIRADRCPLRSQNRQFADYLLTALYYESWKTESWETAENMSENQLYLWEQGASSRNLRGILEARDGIDENTILSDIPEVQKYRRSVERVKSDLFYCLTRDRNRRNIRPHTKLALGTILQAKMTSRRGKLIDNYKDSVLRLLKLERAAG